MNYIHKIQGTNLLFSCLNRKASLFSHPSGEQEVWDFARNSPSTQGGSVLSTGMRVSLGLSATVFASLCLMVALLATGLGSTTSWVLSSIRPCSSGCGLPEKTTPKCHTKLGGCLLHRLPGKPRFPPAAPAPPAPWCSQDWSTLTDMELHILSPGSHAHGHSFPGSQRVFLTLSRPTGLYLLSFNGQWISNTLGCKEQKAQGIVV